MNRKHFLLALGLPLALSAGCQTPQKTEAVAHARLPARTVRSNSYSLLYDLLSKQRNVSKILVIKKERAQLKELIKRIDDASGRGADLLKNFAKMDLSLSLELSLLPPGETATREAIEKTRTQQLLHTSGKDFETNLLLTQMESMNYAAHLAKVAALYEPNAEWSRSLQKLSQEFQELYEDVVSLLRIGYR